MSSLAVGTRGLNRKPTKGTEIRFTRIRMFSQDVAFRGMTDIIQQSTSDCLRESLHLLYLHVPAFIPELC